MFSEIFFWWVLILGLGFLSLPACFGIFEKFYDRGYALAKVMGLMAVSWLVWIGGTLRLFPFGRGTILAAILVWGGFNFFLIRKQKKAFLKKLRKGFQIFLFEEGLFLVGFLAWAYVRSFNPNINGLEKFMDFGFVNAILRSRFFPPNDMWLAGKTINYYYFGHLETAVLTKLSGIWPAVAYNLMLAMTCGLTLVAAFSVVSNLIDWALGKRSAKGWLFPLIGGLVSAVLLTFGGNLQILYHWWKEKSLETYWYPDATRFIVEKYGAGDNTIHEFPVYSWVVADLHGHLLDIPQVLLIIALVLNLVRFPRAGKGKNWGKRILAWVERRFSFGKRQKWFEGEIFEDLKAAFEESWESLPVWLVLGVALGIAFMTNAWDYPIHLLFAGAVIFWFNYSKEKNLRQVGVKTAIGCSWLLGVSLLTALPFYLAFENIAQGVALVDFHSPPWMLLFLWGFPLLTSISFMNFIQRNPKRTVEADHFVLAYILIAWILIFLPEVIYIKDIYIHSHQRANTMFKFTYQSFIVFRLLSGYILVRLLLGLKERYLKAIFFLLFVAGAAVILTYPRYAIRSFYNRLESFKGLDGLKYLSLTYPDDYKAILWLSENIKGDPVIVEAVGESYTDYARVSANTGLPTVLGWRVHEWLWRGGFEIPGQRTEEVTKIYSSGNKEEVRSLLEKYGVELVFMGTLERRTYAGLNEKNLAELGEVIFSSGATKIYRIR